MLEALLSRQAASKRQFSEPESSTVEQLHDRHWGGDRCKFRQWYQLHYLSFISTNFDKQFLRKLYKIKRLYMFRASSAHPQEVNVVNCTCMQPLVAHMYN